MQLTFVSNHGNQHTVTFNRAFRDPRPEHEAYTWAWDGTWLHQTDPDVTRITHFQYVRCGIIDIDRWLDGNDIIEVDINPEHRMPEGF